MTSSRAGPDPHPPMARQRRTRWPGWVWLIPLVALGFAGWLAVEEWVLGPRPLTVHFRSVEGIKPGAPVRFRGVQVGNVERILLDDDLGGATLVLDMSGLRGRLGEGTQIWIERPGFSPGAIGSLISGPFLGIAPSEAGEGELEVLQGLDEAPILEPEEPGRVFVLVDRDGGGLGAGAPVRFRGMDVGRVLGKRFGEGRGIEIPVFVEEPFVDLVREATVFWRAGGLAVDTSGGLDVQLPSLGSIATGAVAFDTPELLQGAPAAAGERFALLSDRRDAAAAETGPRLSYRAVFAEPAGDLARGAPVTLARRQVGHVADSAIEVAPDGRGLVTVVTVVLDATRLNVGGLDTLDSREALRERMDAIIGSLVAAGMRARIAEGSIVFGARSVELVMQPDAAPAALAAGDPPTIPADAAQGVSPSGASPAGSPALPGGSGPAAREPAATAASPAPEGSRAVAPTPGAEAREPGGGAAPLAPAEPVPPGGSGPSGG